MVRYQLPMTTVRLADVFGAVEEEKVRLGIQEYSVTQTTLDHVCWALLDDGDRTVQLR